MRIMEIKRILRVPSRDVLNSL